VAADAAAPTPEPKAPSSVEPVPAVADAASSPSAIVPMREPATPSPKPAAAKKKKPRAPTDSTERAKSESLYPPSYYGR
jgi:hypothetical protein